MFEKVRRVGAARPLQVLGAGALAVTLAGCWSVPGGDVNRSSHNATENGLTAANVDTLEEAFRVDLSEAAGVPLVSGGGLFVTSGLSLHAFDRETGAARWERFVADTGGVQHDLLAISQPYIDGDDILITDRTPRPSLAAHYDLQTISASTGALKRERSFDDLLAVRGTRLASGSRLGAVLPDFSSIAVEDLATGTRWGGVVAASPASPRATLGANRVYASFNDRIDSFDESVPCTPPPGYEAPNVCRAEWSRTLDGTSTDIVISPDGSTLFVATSAGTGYALDAADGAVRWSIPLGAPAAGAPALAEGTVYFGTTGGRLIAAAAAGCGATTCAPAWTAETGAPVGVQPAVAGGVVYTGSTDGSVQAYAAAGCGVATCAPLWSAHTGEAVDGGLAVAFGRLYVGTTTGVTAYEPAARPGT